MRDRIKLWSKMKPGGVGKGLIIGLFVFGILMSFISNFLNAFNGKSDNTEIIMVYAILVIIMFMCARISVEIHKRKKNKDLNRFRKQEADITTKIDEEESKLKKEIENIKANALREQQEYTRQFEQSAQDMSVRFAESDLAKEVIEWMTEGFCKTIDAADRRSHVEQIGVPFTFRIHTSEITCNLGTYDFELHRCRNLSSPIEQTALARAIVSAIQLNIVMKYPKDVSGTDVTINIDYSYTEECPVTTITYIAPNGNYESVRGW